MADFRNTKEGRNVAQKYADILHLSRPEPPVKYPRMALSNRAKIFSPFAALRGFDDEISSEGASKLLVKKVELSDEEKNTLSDKLLQVKKGMKVVVRYFVRSTESTGKYISLTGTVVMIDPVYRELKVMQNSDRKAVSIEKELPVIIPFGDIIELSGEGITNIEDYLGIEKYPDDISGRFLFLLCTKKKIAGVSPAIRYCLFSFNRQCHTKQEQPVLRLDGNRTAIFLRCTPDAL